MCSKCSAALREPQTDIRYEYLGRPIEFADVDPYEHWVVLQRNHAWANRFIPNTEGIEILTDDLNPVDIWSEEINLAARRALEEHFRR